MTKYFKTTALLVLICTVITSCQIAKTEKITSREEINFNLDWNFIQTKQNLNLDAINKQSNWTAARLPHDWSIKNPYNQAYIVTDSTPNLGYIGWYKKDFVLKPEDQNKVIRLDFDGVYNNSEVFINGNKVAERPFGFSAFSADLNPYLKKNDSINTILVKVNNKAFMDSRWYNGAGIYRDVKLVKLQPIHFQKWGTKITTPIVNSQKAEVLINSQIINPDQQVNLGLLFEIKDASGVVIQSKKIVATANHSNATIEIQNPKLWSPDNPNLYTLTASIVDVNGKIWDKQNTTFGIRSLKFTPNDGFYINENKTFIKGVCLHHDAGAIGVAVPDDVWKRRLLILKKGGVNAIRTAHNPPSANFLDLCDQLGFMVQAEAFDEMDYPKDKRRNYNENKEDSLTVGYTNHFHKWGEKDLKDMILRDQNHPSIIMWSIGNEVEWTYPRYSKSSGYFSKDVEYYYDEPPLSIQKIKQNLVEFPPLEFDAATTAQKLSKWAKEIDTSRPITANLVLPSVSHLSGYTDALDIIGYSYRAVVYKYGHQNYPDKMILGTENWANWVEWKSVLDNPHIPGIFLWTGIYYMGETRNTHHRGSNSGLIDFAAFPTPRWHMFKTLWNDEPEIYATTIELRNSDYNNVNGEAIENKPDLWKKRKWSFQNYKTHWNYSQNEEIIVEVYTNCPTAELFLNNKSLGVKSLDSNEDHIIKWIVPYNEGVLTVKGSCKKEVIYEIKTAQKPAALQLIADKSIINSGTDDVAHIEVQLVDESNLPVKYLDQNINFAIEGPARLLGIDNGSNNQQKSFDTLDCLTNNGKLLFMIQATSGKGSIRIKANSENCKSNSITILSK